MKKIFFLKILEEAEKQKNQWLFLIYYSYEVVCTQQKFCFWLHVMARGQPLIFLQISFLVVVSVVVVALKRDCVSILVHFAAPLITIFLEHFSILHKKIKALHRAYACSHLVNWYFVHVLHIQKQHLYSWHQSGEFINHAYDTYLAKVYVCLYNLT